MSEALVTLRGIRRRAQGTVILQGCDWPIPYGLTALVGPNGAGKTTLLRIAAGILHADGGELRWGEREPASPSSLRRLVAYVPQFPGLHPRLTVAEHLERDAMWSGSHHPRQRARQTLRRLGLDRWGERRCERLDGAERRLVAVARAWVRRCRLILFDEPTADLDPEARARFWFALSELLRADASVKAAVVTTHLFDEVTAFTSQVAVLARGRILYAGPVTGLAQAAQGRCACLPAAASGTLPGDIVGVDADGRYRVLLPVGVTAPPGSEPRAPLPLDGYLVTIRGEAG